jgi:hypothetical protein
MHTILQKNDGTLAMGINPASIGIWWYPFKSCKSFRNLTIFSDGIQTDPWEVWSQKICRTKCSNKKHLGALGILHCSCSHADSMISIRKASHSSRWTIFAIRSDTWLSREDTFFSKPKDFLAWSMAVLARCFKRDNRPSRLAILDRCLAQRQEEWWPEGTP